MEDVKGMWYTEWMRVYSLLSAESVLSSNNCTNGVVRSRGMGYEKC